MEKKTTLSIHTLTEWWKNLPAFSLRNRIAIYYTVATSFLIAAVFTIIYFMVGSVVYRQFDEEIKKEVSEILTEANVNPNDFKGFDSFKDIENSAVRRAPDSDGDNVPGGKSDNDADNVPTANNMNVDTEFIEIVNRSGEVVKKSSSLSWCVLAFDPSRPEATYFNSSFGEVAIRQIQVPLKNSKGITEGFLIVAVPTKNAIIVLHDLRLVFLLSFPLIILTLFILTRLIAVKSIRPVEKIISTAEKMTQVNLHQRFALPYHHDELYRLSTTINAMLDRMQDAFQREKQFTADASHELKTPLATVKGTLEVLVRKPREREHYESRILFCLQELNRMASLIDQLLMLARYDRHGLRPKTDRVVLFTHLEEVIARKRPEAKEKEIAITTTLPEELSVRADPAMLDIIFDNIISNAIKYSPPESAISITTEQVENSVECTIVDQGIGIPEEKINSIFERFYRVDESRNSGTGGSGLGLSIVKKLTDLQNIKISLKSGKGKGTTVRLTIPSA